MNADWYYIAGVVLAFFIFLGWNKSQQKSVKNRKRRNFKQGFKDKKKGRNKSSTNDDDR